MNNSHENQGTNHEYEPQTDAELATGRLELVLGILAVQENMKAESRVGPSTAEQFRRTIDEMFEKYTKFISRSKDGYKILRLVNKSRGIRGRVNIEANQHFYVHRLQEKPEETEGNEELEIDYIMTWGYWNVDNNLQQYSLLTKYGSDEVIWRSYEIDDEEMIRNYYEEPLDDVSNDKIWSFVLDSEPKISKLKRLLRK